ncbi:RluA family pseudouridine synthase [Aerococcus christensenii]|uniref:RluA family pseudouridine synthase n=1 Tax=Aerococcus christensenii TaxID=87541 RepID=UPI003F438582
MLFFSWVCEEAMSVRTFLKRKGVSRKQLADIKYRQGYILVNNKIRRSRHRLEVGDKVTVVYPPEGLQDSILPVAHPLEILYEDRDYLIINKPSGYTSIPSYAKEEPCMANFVKAYYQEKAYDNQVIHVVTRLDRYTSGAMLFAKHKYAHSMMDTLMQKGGLDKRYYAYTKDLLPQKHGVIEVPIGRKEDSILERCVRPDGQYAKTEYWWLQDLGKCQQYEVKLYTGRTHQIRVHFAYLGSPLCGDDFYKGSVEPALQGQALHCHHLVFIQPITGEVVDVEAPLSEELSQWLNLRQ